LNYKHSYTALLIAGERRENKTHRTATELTKFRGV